jgi:hypothetical protein
MINFQPNCTFPTSTPSGFVQSPLIRSTTDIIWTCMTVLLLSTWSTLHLNVPPDLRPTTKLQEFRKELYLFGRKLGWMAIMLAFPEYFVGIATTNLFAAWVNNAHLEAMAKNDGVPWSLTHTVLANIGGIAIQFNKSTRSLSSTVTDDDITNGNDGSSDPRPNNGPESHGVPIKDSMMQLDPAVPLSSLAPETTGTTVRACPPRSASDLGELPDFIQKFQQSQQRHLSGLGSSPWSPDAAHIWLAANARPHTQWIQQNVEKYNYEQYAPLHGDIWVLDSKQLSLARDCGIIAKLPNITVQEIEDKSKIDGLIRLIALIQCLWFALELIARRVLGTPSSALEISTAAFTACAFIIYIIEWPKPKDINVPFYYSTTSTVSPANFALIAEAAPITFLQPRRYYMTQSCVHQVLKGRFTKGYVDRMVVLVSIVSITVYGGIHFFAWDMSFPTKVEQLLWRISALVVTIAPAISALLVLSEDLVRHRTDKLSKWSVAFLAPAYLAARLYIIAESFRALYFMPPKAFIATWTANAPHIG